MIHKHADLIKWLRKYGYKVTVETKDFDSDFWAVKFDETALIYVDGTFEMYCFVNNEHEIRDYAYRIKTNGFADLEQIYVTIKKQLNAFEEYHMTHSKFGEAYNEKLNGIARDFQ